MSAVVPMLSLLQRSATEPLLRTFGLDELVSLGCGEGCKELASL